MFLGCLFPKNVFLIVCFPMSELTSFQHWLNLINSILWLARVRPSVIIKPELNSRKRSCIKCWFSNQICTMQSTEKNVDWSRANLIFLLYTFSVKGHFSLLLLSLMNSCRTVLSPNQIGSSKIVLMLEHSAYNFSVTPQIGMIFLRLCNVFKYWRKTKWRIIIWVKNLTNTN